MPKFQKFNDGIADIYSVENIAEKGDRPKERLKIKYHLRFGYSVIGRYPACGQETYSQTA